MFIFEADVEAEVDRQRQRVLRIDYRPDEPAVARVHRHPEGDRSPASA